MPLSIKDHKLDGDDVTFQETKKTSGGFKTGFPDTIVIHYTAGASADSSVRTLIDPAVKASAHIVLGRDGKIIQLAPFDIITWHAGTSRHMDRSGINKYSIGIEIDNPGPLEYKDGNYYTWFGRKVDPSEVMKATHRNQNKPGYWHRYTEGQITRTEEMCRLLIAQYNIKYIVGHEEISPTRKTDPGPAFPLDNLRGRLLTDRSEDVKKVDKDGSVSASSLNIRSGPGAHNDKVAKPLKNGAAVKVLEEDSGWYKVETSITGWVSKDHVKLK